MFDCQCRWDGSRAAWFRYSARQHFAETCCKASNICIIAMLLLLIPSYRIFSDVIFSLKNFLVVRNGVLPTCEEIPHQRSVKNESIPLWYTGYQRQLRWITSCWSRHDSQSTTAGCISLSNLKRPLNCRICTVQGQEVPVRNISSRTLFTSIL